MTEKSSNIWEELRKPFPKESVGKLPKGGVQLDYVGHAAVTDRLNTVDPTWTWEPMATDEAGLPLFTQGEPQFGKPTKGLWIRLTIGGVTRPGYGDGKNEKEAIGDALRNAAMRFGVALDLWSKDELESNVEHPENKNVKPTQAKPAPKPLPEVVEEEAVSDDMLTKLKGQVKLKGIADDKKAGGILEALAQKEYKRTSAAMTVDQARALYLLIRDSSTRDDLLDLLKQESAHAEI